MRLFSVSEANELLPVLEPMLENIRSFNRLINSMRESALAAAASSESGGGMPGGTPYVEALYKVGELTKKISEMGVEVKDYDRGLIDFPSMRGTRVVLLCWQLGEGREVEWWHELEAGFAGRQPL